MKEPQENSLKLCKYSILSFHFFDVNLNKLRLVDLMLFNFFINIKEKYSLKYKGGIEINARV